MNIDIARFLNAIDVAHALPCAALCRHDASRPLRSNRGLSVRRFKLLMVLVFSAACGQTGTWRSADSRAGDDAASSGAGAEPADSGAGDEPADSGTGDDPADSGAGGEPAERQDASRSPTTRVPPCLDSVGGDPIAIDNAQVVEWKASSPNQFKARAHVTGIVAELYMSQGNTQHFSIALDGAPESSLEVIYDKAFKPLPEPVVGHAVEACGDYITSNAPTDQYPASPDGALIHYLHKADWNPNHPDGFLVVNGVVYGTGIADNN